MDPQPLSITASGGQKIESNTLQILMMICFSIDDFCRMTGVFIGRIKLPIVTSLNDGEDCISFLNKI